jgi:hypothetical protein
MQHAVRLAELAAHVGAKQQGAVAQLVTLAWPPPANRADADARRAKLDLLLQELPNRLLSTPVLLTKARISRDINEHLAAAEIYEIALKRASNDFASCPPELLPAGLEWTETLQRLGRTAEAKAALARLAPCAEAMYESSPWRRRWELLAGG